MTNQSFIRYLTKSQMSQNTIRSYCFAVDEYNSMFQIVSTSNLLKYKRYLLGKYSPSTANVRIRAINRYLRFIGKGKLALHGVKIQQVSFLGDTLDDNTYEIFKSCLKGESNLQWYFIVSVLSTTGVRIGELVRIKAEQVILGYIDVIGKGGKCRRVFLTDSLRNELLMWMELIKRCKGPLFRNKFGDQISTRGVSAQLQRLAMKYGVDPDIAGFFSSIAPFGTILMTPLFGYVYDRYGRGVTLVITGALLLAAVHFGFSLPIHNSSVAILLMVVLSVGYSLAPAALWPCVPKIIPLKCLGTAYSMIFFIQNFGRAIIPMFVGRANETDPSYTTSMLIFGFTALGAALVAIAMWYTDRRKGYGLQLPNIK